jgi:hypothetical protein
MYLCTLKVRVRTTIAEEDRLDVTEQADVAGSLIVKLIGALLMTDVLLTIVVSQLMIL